jgi:hypothetical protein
MRPRKFLLADRVKPSRLLQLGAGAGNLTSLLRNRGSGIKWRGGLCSCGGHAKQHLLVDECDLPHTHCRSIVAAVHERLMSRDAVAEKFGVRWRPVRKRFGIRNLP